MFRAICPSCRAALRVGDHVAGKRCKCAKCGTVFVADPAPRAANPAVPAAVPVRSPDQTARDGGAQGGGGARVQSASTATSGAANRVRAQVGDAGDEGRQDVAAVAICSSVLGLAAPVLTGAALASLPFCAIGCVAGIHCALVERRHARGIAIAGAIGAVIGVIAAAAYIFIYFSAESDPTGDFRIDRSSLYLVIPLTFSLVAMMALVFALRIGSRERRLPAVLVAACLAAAPALSAVATMIPGFPPHELYTLLYVVQVIYFLSLVALFAVMTTPSLRGAVDKPLAGQHDDARSKGSVLWRRELAYLVDIMLANVVAVGAFRARVEDGPNGFQREFTPRDIFFYAVATFIVVTVYILTKDGIGGMSIGKRLLRVRVVDAETGRPIGFAQSVARNWLFLLPGIPLVELVVANVSPDGRRLGDRRAGTVVERVLVKRAPDACAD